MRARTHGKKIHTYTLFSFRFFCPWLSLGDSNDDDDAAAADEEEEEEEEESFNVYEEYLGSIYQWLYVVVLGFSQYATYSTTEALISTSAISP